MLRNTGTSYGWIAIVLHWTIGLLVIGQVVLGLLMARLEDQRLSFDLIQLHKSLGFLTLALALARIAWRLADPAPAPPAGTPPLERRAAAVSHAVLYLLMLGLPLTGWVLVSVSPLDMPTFAFYRVLIPNLPLPMSEPMEDLWSTVHRLVAYLMLGLICVHVLAALRHHFWLRDSVLMRMIRPQQKP